MRKFLEQEQYTEILEEELLGKLLSENEPECSSLTQTALRAAAMDCLSDAYIDELIMIEAARKKALLYSPVSQLQLLIDRDMRAADNLFINHHYKEATILYRAVIKIKPSLTEQYKAITRLAECFIYNANLALVCQNDFPEISFAESAVKYLHPKGLALLFFIKILQLECEDNEIGYQDTQIIRAKALSLFKEMHLESHFGDMPFAILVKMPLQEVAGCIFTKAALKPVIKPTLWS